MTFTIDGQVYEDEFAYTASNLGVVAPPKETSPEAPKRRSMVDEWNNAVEDIIMAGPGWKPYKGWEQKGQVEDRRQDTIATNPEPPSKEDVAEFYGDNINPGQFVMNELAHALGVNRLNEMIVRKESQPKAKPKVIELDPLKPKDDIDQLLEKMDRWKKNNK